MKYLYNPPLFIKKIFNNSQWNTINGKILLTFDDGPRHGTTDIILKILNDNRIKSIFFCVGNNIKKNSSLCSSLIIEGHTIANHTFNHRRLIKLKRDEIHNEIDLFNQLMKSKYDYKVKYFRPPHGRMNFSIQRIIKEKGMKNIMWSLLTYDYKNDLNLVKFAAKKYLKPDSIIVLHDNLKSKEIIIPSINFILEEADKKGYEIGEPDGCLK